MKIGPIQESSLRLRSRPADGKSQGGGRTRLPKFRFSAKLPIGLHMILQIQIRKFGNDSYIMLKNYFNRKSRWGSTLNPSWSNSKWVLFINHMALYATVSYVAVAKLNWALPASSGKSHHHRVPPLSSTKWSPWLDWCWCRCSNSWVPPQQVPRDLTILLFCFVFVCLFVFWFWFHTQEERFKHSDSRFYLDTKKIQTFRFKVLLRYKNIQTLRFKVYFDTKRFKHAVSRICLDTKRFTHSALWFYFNTKRMTQMER